MGIPVATNQPGAMRLEHQPVLEGLRALAIILVVSSHFDIPGMSGGFIGVDIFFVLSGYLITRLLLTERAHTGKIDIPMFYARRFRRLLPALVTMIIVTGIAGWNLLPTKEINDQLVSSIAAMLWLSNMRFALADLDYFDTTQDSDLFLHTWSLGVEEQFYLFWPLLIGLTLWKKPISSRTLFALFYISIPIGIVATILVTRTDPQAAFYYMPLRAWQFSAGAVSFHLSVTESDIAKRLRKSYSNSIGLVGLAIITISIYLIDINSAYPGVWSTIPTLATIMLLYVSNNMQGGLSFRILSHPLSQWIGNRSYSLYLWHWPIVLLGATILPIQNYAVKLTLIFVSFVISALSFKYIENPTRKSDRWTKTPSKTIFLSLVTMVTIAIGASQLQHESPPDNLIISRPKVTSPIIYSQGCDDWYESSLLKPCIFGKTHENMHILVIGDSIGLQWFPAYEKFASEEQAKLTILTKSACAIVDTNYVYPRIGREYTECSEWRGRALQYAKLEQPDLIVVGSSHTYDFSDQQWKEGTYRILADLSPVTKSILIIRSTPLLPFDGPACASIRGRIHDALRSDETCSATAFDEHNERVALLLNEASADFANVSVLDLNAEVCPNQICRATINDTLVFRDHQHLNARFVESISSTVADRIRSTIHGDTFMSNPVETMGSAPSLDRPKRP